MPYWMITSDSVLFHETNASILRLVTQCWILIFVPILSLTNSANFSHLIWYETSFHFLIAHRMVRSCCGTACVFLFVLHFISQQNVFDALCSVPFVLHSVLTFWQLSAKSKVAIKLHTDLHTRLSGANQESGAKSTKFHDHSSQTSTKSGSELYTERMLRESTAETHLIAHPDVVIVCHFPFVSTTTTIYSWQQAKAKMFSRLQAVLDSVASRHGAFGDSNEKRFSQTFVL